MTFIEKVRRNKKLIAELEKNVPKPTTPLEKGEFWSASVVNGEAKWVRTINP